ncbi:hypothetical protein C8Q80DRAFT_715762 [Daedaleopsis nitida]|nr:hypothetical protein C8Q80DRAFT_715762 [Daedaleopsis nitida]
MATPMLSHAQSGPSRRAQEERLTQTSRSMPPPPVPTTRVADPRIAARQPPSTPLSLPSRPSFLPSVGVSQAPTSSGAQRFVPSTPSRTSAAPSATATPRSFVPQVGSQSRTQQQRFLPIHGSNPSLRLPPPGSAVPQSGSLATSGMVSQAPSRSPSMAGTGSGGQRTPFISGPSGGLG